MTSRDYIFFNSAKEISKLSTYKRVHIGCVVVYKNKIISSGCNSNKTNPLQKRYNSVRFSVDTPHTLHAETDAILSLRKMQDLDTKHIKVYLYREHADGSIALSRPCPSCIKMLKDNNIHNIFYTTNDGYAQEDI